MTFRSRLFFVVLSIAFVSACTETPTKKMGMVLDPLLGRAKKEDVNKALRVSPASCKTQGGEETCEYRTAITRNDPLPDTASQNPAMGPDLSPLEYFEVIFVTYDGLGIFKDWRSAEPSPPALLPATH